MKIVSLLRTVLTAFESGDRDEMIRIKFVAHRYGFPWLDHMIKRGLRGEIDGVAALKKEISARKKAAIRNINFQLEHYDRWIDAAMNQGSYSEAEMLRAKQKNLNAEAMAIDAA